MYRTAFPHMPPLPSILAALSIPQQFSTAVIPREARRSDYLDVLVWMLKMDLVIQLRTFIRVVATQDIKRAAREARRAAASSDEGEGRTGVTTDEASSTGEQSPGWPNRQLTDGEGSSSPEISTAQKGTSWPGSTAMLGSSEATPPSPMQSRFSLRSQRGKPRRQALLRTISGRSVASSRRTNGTGTSDEARDTANSVIAEPGQPSPWERRWLVQIVYGRPDNLVSRFERQA